MKKLTIFILVAFAALAALGPRPSSAAFAQSQPGSMTIDQVYTTLMGQANDLINAIKNKDIDSSKKALATFQTTFTAHRDEIKANSATTQTKLAGEIDEVKDGLDANNFDKAADDAGDLVSAIKKAQAAPAASSAPATSNSSASTGNTTSADSTSSGTTSTTANDAMPDTGQPAWPVVLVLVVVAGAALFAGSRVLRRKAS